MIAKYFEKIIWRYYWTALLVAVLMLSSVVKILETVEKSNLLVVGGLVASSMLQVCHCTILCRTFKDQWGFVILYTGAFCFQSHKIINDVWVLSHRSLVFYSSIAVGNGWFSHEATQFNYL